MHPTCKQVPPRKGSFSTTTVFSPSSPARIAATYPPGPLPIIATSYFATRSLPSTGARTGDQTWWSDCRHTSVTLEETRGGRAKRRGASRSPYGRHSKTSVLRTPFQTDKKPPALTAQTAASQQTRNFNSRSPPSQPCLGLFYSLAAGLRNALPIQAKIRRICYLEFLSVPEPAVASRFNRED